jgi:hypothetical protein
MAQGLITRIADKILKKIDKIKYYFKEFITKIILSLYAVLDYVAILLT